MTKRRRMKIDALAAYFVNTCGHATTDGDMGFGTHWNGTMHT